MTLQPSTLYFNMDNLPPDDIMDLASSPFKKIEEDLDLDALPDMMEHVEDQMNDGSTYGQQGSSVQMHFDIEDYHDDEMADEDTTEADFNHRHEDLNMDGYIHEEDDHIDNDILIEDDEELVESSSQKAEDQEDLLESNETNQEFTETSDDNTAVEAIRDHGLTNDATNIDEDLLANVSNDQHKIGSDRVEGNASPEEDHSDAEIPGDGGHSASDEDAGSEHIESIAIPDTHPQNRESDVVEQDTLAPNAETTSAPTDKTISISIDSNVLAKTELNIQGNGPSNPHSHEISLHPVKVIYQDNEICLFPPGREETVDTFFLADINLAHETLDRLLAACRDVLAGTIGDDDELVLDIASLGLHITEDSKYASQITLSQILDVYLALSHNENFVQVEPLYCSLTSRVCLISQYSYLSSSAQAGKSYTEISTEYLGSSNDSADGEDVNFSQHANENLQQEERTDDVDQFEAGEEDLHVESRQLDDEQSSYDDVGLDNEQYQHYEVEEVSEDHRWDAGLQEENQESTNVGTPTSTVQGDVFHPEAHPQSDAENYIETELHETEGYAAGKSEHCPSDQIDAKPLADAAEDEEVTETHRKSQEFQAGESEGQLELPHDDRDEQNGFDLVEPDETDDVQHNLEQHDPGELDIEELFDEDEGVEEVENEESFDAQDASEESRGPVHKPTGNSHLEPPNTQVEQQSGNLIQDQGPHMSSDPLDDTVEHEDLFESVESVTDQTQPTEHGNTPTEVHGSNGTILSTPTKGKMSKRKIEHEDEELDLLDIDTPDAKRQRPS